MCARSCGGVFEVNPSGTDLLAGLGLSGTRTDRLNGLQALAMLGLCPTCGDLVASVIVIDPADVLPAHVTGWQTLRASPGTVTG
jgi:hypothetical protein